ncbi:MAG TPA: DUF2330 domain-containing protein [Myxococcota bacterium]|jgi:hypothetical protein
MRTSVAVIVVVMLTAAFGADPARAMCGCMLRPRPDVKKGETLGAKIVNKSSKVILARDGDTTSMTLANDFVGAPAHFGLVVPVPTVIHKEDVKVVGDEVFDRLERATAPTVTEVFDDDDCARPSSAGAGMLRTESVAPAAAPKASRAADYGVKVESHFFAGEYEIAVLSGTNANGLIAWLQKFDYDVPDDAKEVLQSYIKQKMMFFLARVYVKEMGTGPRHLRPIQVRYQTPKLMLPIRLGMVNADGAQELLVFALTSRGRVDTTNYRTVKMPTGAKLPYFAKDAWTEVYGAMFDEQEKREDKRVLFIEAQDRLAVDDSVKKAGAFWQSGQAFVTRLHFRYASDQFPEDLQLQSTDDASTFRVRMEAIKPAQSPCNVPAANRRRDQERQAIANLTGWSMETVLQKAGLPLDSETPPGKPHEDKWYERLWK